MHRLLVLLAAAVSIVLAASPDPWAAVVKLKSGAEIRVWKKGSMQPVLGKFDEANDERLILVVKNEQTAIPREQIERLDARPAQQGSRVKVESKTTTDDPQKAKEPTPGMYSEPAVGGTSSSSSVHFGGKPDFETVYRRPAGAPKTPDSKADTKK
jgi:hypothetical protein